MSENVVKFRNPQDSSTLDPIEVLEEAVNKFKLELKPQAMLLITLDESGIQFHCAGGYQETYFTMCDEYKFNKLREKYIGLAD